jgi:hypothetical protein
MLIAPDSTERGVNFCEKSRDFVRVAQRRDGTVQLVAAVD